MVEEAESHEDISWDKQWIVNWSGAGYNKDIWLWRGARMKPLKSAKQPSFQSAYVKLKEEIAEELKRHRYVLESGALEFRLSTP